MLKADSVCLKENTIKYGLAIVFICGWLLPKLNVGGVNIGIQELVALMLILYNYRISSHAMKVFRADIYFSVAYLLFAILHFIRLLDYEGLLIGVRTMIFLFAGLGLSSFDEQTLKRTIKSVTFINICFLTWSVSRIILHTFSTSFDIINFFYGGDSYRVRAPFENGGASSQVPIGYMIALMFCIPVVYFSLLKRVIVIIGAIGTTSRASIISLAIVMGKRLKVASLPGILSLIVVAVLIVTIYLKSFSANEGDIDGSANKRFELYLSSINIMISNPESILIGFGLSTASLENATGEGFYESFLFNSLMQGGLFLFVSSVWILVKTFYYDYKYNLYSASIVVFFGNAIGGSNYFSMYAFPLFMLLVFSALKRKEN